MVAKVKPLTTAQKTVIKELALTLVFSEIEQKVIKPTYEKTGKSTTHNTLSHLLTRC